MGTVRRHLPEAASTTTDAGTVTHLPVVVGTPPQTTPTVDTQDPPREPVTITVSDSADGKARSLVYGQREVTGQYFLATGSGSSLVIAYDLCSGPAEQIVSYTLAGYPSTGPAIPGVTVQLFTGTSAQLVSSILASAVAGYVERHPYRVYAAVSIDGQSSIFGSVPEFKAIIKGRKDVYDPRLDVTPGASPTNPAYQAYSENPALCLAHLVTAWDLGGMDTADVDWARVVTAANYCDEHVGGLHRWLIGALVTERRRVSDLVTALLAEFRAWQQWATGKWYPCWDIPGPSRMTIDKQSMRAASYNGSPGYALEMATLNVDDMPTAVRVQYTEPALGYATYPQSYPAALVLGGQDQVLELSAPDITSAAVAARLAEETYWERKKGLRWPAQCNRKPVLLERGDGAELLFADLLMDRARLLFDASTAYATSAATAALDLTAAGSIEARIRCDGVTGATQAIVDRFGPVSGGYGYALLVTATGYLAIRWGAVAVTTDAMIADGAWHHVAMTVGSALLRVYLDGAVLYFRATAVTVAQGVDDTSIGARDSAGSPTIPFRGCIEGVRIWSDERTPEEIEQWAWRDDPEQTGLVAKWNIDDTDNDGAGKLYDSGPGGYHMTVHGAVTWGRRGRPVRVTSMQPDGVGNVSLQLADRYPKSWAIATVPSTLGTIVDRVPTVTALATPDPQETAPAVTSLNLAVVEDEAGQVRLKILATWVESASGFIRGYRITVTAGAKSRTLEDTGRHSPSKLLDVITPGVSHTVAVVPIAASGVLGTGASASITPGGAAPSVSLALHDSSRVKALLQQSGSAVVFKSGVDYWFQGGVSATTYVDHLEVMQNGHVLGWLDKAATDFDIFNGRRANTNDYPMTARQAFEGVTMNGGDVITLRAVLVDGRIVNSAGVTLSSPGTSIFESDVIENAGDIPVFRADGQTLNAAVGASPGSGAVLYLNGSTWIWAKAVAGVATIANGNSTVRVTHGLTFSATTYAIAIAVGGNEFVWYDPATVATTYFDLVRTGTTGALEVRWVCWGT